MHDANEEEPIRMVFDWDRVREIFDYPDPPTEVWERQFDNFDKELRVLATTHWTEIGFRDLWYYHLDLAYVSLQPEVFRYLFPVCLMEWHASLQIDESSHSGSDLHTGLSRGRVIEKMLTPAQYNKTVQFFRDSFLFRLDAEAESDGSRHFGWLCRLNSLARILPEIPSIWRAWWNMETPGRAIAVLQYASGLVYWQDQNPLIPGGDLPSYFVHDSYGLDNGWHPENIEFLSMTLTVDYIRHKVREAADMLHDHRIYADKALGFGKALEERLQILGKRLEAFPKLLELADEPRWWPWWDD